jgi:hypothetical protein
MSNKDFSVTLFLDWLHNVVKNDSLEIIHVTNGKETSIGLYDSKTKTTFNVGVLHDLSFLYFDPNLRDIKL